MLEWLSSAGAGQNQTLVSARRLQIGPESRPYLHAYMRPVIQSGPLEVSILQLEAQRFDQMKIHVHGRAQTRYVSRIGGNFRLKEYNIHTGRQLVDGYFENRADLPCARCP